MMDNVQLSILEDPIGLDLESKYRDSDWNSAHLHPFNSHEDYRVSFTERWRCIDNWATVLLLRDITIDQNASLSGRSWSKQEPLILLFQLPPHEIYKWDIQNDNSASTWNNIGMFWGNFGFLWRTYIKLHQIQRKANTLRSII